MKTKIPAQTALSDITAAAANLDLSQFEFPTARKCKHYKPIGKIDDFTLKLFAYSVLLLQRRGERIEQFSNIDWAGRIDAVRGTAAFVRQAEEAAKQKALRELERELAPTDRHLLLLGQIIIVEVARQYPDLDNNVLHNIMFDHDGMIGWNDHSDSSVGVFVVTSGGIEELFPSRY